MGEYCIFIDEDNINFINSIVFAALCKYTDSFFVIITREPVVSIPYSYTDIYIMRTSGKFHYLERSIPDKLNVVI